jgi:acetyltransferase-like isoleucine patch superfamily enzyme
VYKKIKGFFWKKIFSPIYCWCLKRKGIVVGRQVIFFGWPIIECKAKGQIFIGDNVVLCSDPLFTALGVRQKVIIRAITEDALIVLGNNVGASGVTICAAKSIRILENTILGANVLIMDTDFHSIEPKGRRRSGLKNAKVIPIIINENVFVGAGSMVLKGAVINKNSVIGAMSLVASEIEASCIAVGVPAKCVKYIN